jgi:hypothetical protein
VPRLLLDHQAHHAKCTLACAAWARAALGSVPGVGRATASGLRSAAEHSG